MFPDLPPYAPPTDAARDQAKKLGEKGGLIDALDNLTDPIKSITEPSIFCPNNPDNPNMTAGVTFFRQFLDHDITLDPRSQRPGSNRSAWREAGAAPICRLANVLQFRRWQFPAQQAD
ncbi:MAG: hypothetical protein E8D49_12395 [Nitrospira sp.]|nr:MAG: hypothetical protein E8D49_12395 [Nitrospira sp.]